MYKKLRVTQPTEEWMEMLSNHVDEQFCIDFEKAVQIRMKIIGCSDVAMRIAAESLEGCWDACDDFGGIDGFGEHMLYWMTATRNEIEDFYEGPGLTEEEIEKLDQKRLQG
jgi:hypothetical protein